MGFIEFQGCKVLGWVEHLFGRLQIQKIIRRSQFVNMVSLAKSLSAVDAQSSCPIKCGLVSPKLAL